MERELGALAHRPGEDEQRDERDGRRVELADALDDLADVERAQADEDEQDPEDEADVADTVDDERLLGRERRRALPVPEPDEQVAAQADQLPGHEHDQEVAGQDQQQHREHEQVEVGEEPPVARVVAHVADRVDVDEQADRRDHDQQARRQRVDDETDVDGGVRVAERDPGEPLDDVAVRVLGARQQRRGPAQDVEAQDHRDDPDREDRADRDPVRLLPEPPPDDRGQQESRHRQDDQRLDQAISIHQVPGEHVGAPWDGRWPRCQLRVFAHAPWGALARMLGCALPSTVRRRARQFHDAHWRIASYSSTSGVFLLR